MQSHRIEEVPGRASLEPIPYSFFKQTAEDCGLGLTKVDIKSGRFIDANPQFCQMIGYSLDEVTGPEFNCSTITHPDDAKNCVDLLDRLVRGKIDSYTTEKRYVLKDKSILSVRATITALKRDTAGRAEITVCFVRKLGDARLLTDNFRLPGPFADVTFWYRDFKTKTAVFPEAHRQLLGLASGGPAPTFRENLSRVHPEDRRRVTESTARAMKGTVQTVELRFIRPDGGVCWLRQTLKPILNEEGEVVGMLGTCLDITNIAQPSDASKPTRTIKTIKNYIDLNWNRPLSAAVLAKAANVNKRTLYKHCTLAWGYTPKDYIKIVRLNHARAMLEMADENATVLGVALKCCFQNQGHFARDFRLAFGERPSDTLARCRQLRKHYHSN